MGRLAADAASRTSVAIARWPSWSPWEKLSRAQFMPADTSAAILCFVSLAGPSVQTILVRLTSRL